MKNEYLSSDEAQNKILELSEKMNELLVEGRTYHYEAYRNEFGSSSNTGIYFYENGVFHDDFYVGKYDKEELGEHLDGLRDCRLSDLIPFFPVHSKIKFTFTKGELIKAERYSVSMLLEDIKKEIEERYPKYSEDDSVFIKSEALIHFKKEADEIGVFTDSTYHYNDKLRSFGHFVGSKEILSIYHQLGGKIENLYLIYENDMIKVQSHPAFEDYGFEPLTVSQIEFDANYQRQKQALLDCKKQRHDFFDSIGKLDERIIYLRVGGFRNHSWPQGSSGHNSCKMRVIHAPESTILITDGLSDIYKDFYYGQNSEYNGIGAEFYMEFHGNIPYEIIHEHFAVALVNSVSQIAIGHGDFKALMEKFGEATLEFTEENIELWVNRENKANHNVSSFLPSKDFMKNDSFGVFLGVESKTVPQKLKLNLEEILLISIKPVENKWLKTTKIRSKNNTVAKAAREEIMQEWKESGEMNLVPLTYQKEYLETSPESGGTSLVPIFPF
jgi:hypothetical protein